MKVKPHSVIPLPQTECVDLSFILIPLNVKSQALYQQMILLVRGERDGVEIITAGVSRLIRDPDRTSTGSTQSTGNTLFNFLSFSFHLNHLFQLYSFCFCYIQDKESSPASRTTTQGSIPGCTTFVEVKTEVEEEEGRFADPELPYRVTEDGKKRDLYAGFPSRADEALKTCK